MQEPAGNRGATGSTNGGRGAELSELRRILIGPELDQIARIQNRLDDAAVRSAEVGRVLPLALRSAPGKGLRDALEPVFEKSFQSSVRKHPRELADAIYPVIGPAIRASIAAAIREFAESLNQIIEKSASWRAIRWRIEAWGTGKPFVEILLARSLLYSVEQVFLIHRRSGLLLLHLVHEGTGGAPVVKDADMISGMLTAVQDFVSDSFTESRQELETADIGRYKLWIQYGPKALLAGAVSGTAPVELKAVFRFALDKIHEELYAALDTFKQDDLSVFEPARPHMEACLLGQRRLERRFRAWPWVVLAAALAALAAFVYVPVRNQGRWERYVEAIRRQPGIVVTRAERQGPTWVMEGLKDPKAPDPAALLSSYQVEPAKVLYRWQQYFSLDTAFAVERALDADIERIEKQSIRFELGSSKLLLLETGRIEDVAQAFDRVRKLRPEVRLTITGHTDEVGAAETNQKLSFDRAVQVSDALAAQGIPRRLFFLVGMGDTQPVRTGGTEFVQAINRSVSFKIELERAQPR
jgi:outer membrane protein OmpA-like peptidoglycan-associated protein